MQLSVFFDSNGVTLHCIECYEQREQIPLIIIPGATTTAKDIVNDMYESFPYYHYVLDMRGKGFSEVPETGYSVENLANDVWSMMQQLDIPKAVVFGYSVGAGIALELYSQQPNHIVGVVLGDYPPIYPPFDQEWADRAKQINPHLHPTFFEATVRESKFKEFVGVLADMTCPSLLIKGGKEGSLFPNEYIDLFEQTAQKGQIAILEDSDHDIFMPNSQVLSNVLLNFMKQINQQ